MLTHCFGCQELIEVRDDEVHFCCDGSDCGCRGLPIDLIVCDDCFEKAKKRGDLQSCGENVTEDMKKTE